MMTRKKEESMINKLCAKEWKCNASKASESMILLDLIAMLRAKAKNVNANNKEI